MTTETVNDLIKINNDRIAGYEKASRQTDDKSLQPFFAEMANQSRQFVSELRSLVTQEGENHASGTTTSGKIYRTWMDVKATFGGDDREGILKSCEFGEDAAQKAYDSALEDDDLKMPVRDIVMQQQQSLKAAHNKISTMISTLA